MFKKFLTISTILAIFIAYIVIQNYQPSNKQSVANAIIQKNGKILIAQRAKADALLGKWEFPGGKVETNEHLHDCLKRELKEELGIDAKIGKYFGTNTVYGQDKVYEIHLFKVDRFNGSIELNNEHTQYAWVTPSELSNYDMLDSCLPFIKTLQKNS